MNKSKAVVGWKSDLQNGRDFRVEDHLDGRGQVVVWLREGAPAPGPADIEAGWSAWVERSAVVPADPLLALASQLKAVCGFLGSPLEPAFQALLNSQSAQGLVEEARYDR